MPCHGARYQKAKREKPLMGHPTEEWNRPTRPEEYGNSRPLVEPARGSERPCRCCGDSFIIRFPGHARFCPDCRVQAVRIKRQAAMVDALWERFPEISMMVVSGLRDKGGWPG